MHLPGGINNVYGMELRGKAALVTGGAVRIGRAIALALAGAGADVVVHCRNSRREAEALAREVAAKGPRGWILDADLSSEDACAQLVASARQAAGRLDILVNSAAVFRKDDVATFAMDEAAAQLRINLLAPLSLMRAFAAQAGQGGCIVNLLDTRIAGHDTTCFSYTLSKTALAEATALAALDLAPRVRVNGVAPGAVLPPPGEGPDRVRELAGRSPLERRCTAEDVADAVLFLLRNDAVTGQIVFVDGGQHLRPLTPET